MLKPSNSVINLMHHRRVRHTLALSDILGEVRRLRDEVRRLRDDVTETLRVSSFRGIYPALSDNMAALVDDHVERILRELAEEMEERLGGVSQRF
jgi:hypothetical protein